MHPPALRWILARMKTKLIKFNPQCSCLQKWLWYSLNFFHRREQEGRPRTAYCRSFAAHPKPKRRSLKYFFFLNPEPNTLLQDNQQGSVKKVSRFRDDLKCWIENSLGLVYALMQPNQHHELQQAKIRRQYHNFRIRNNFDACNYCFPVHSFF